MKFTKKDITNADKRLEQLRTERYKKGKEYRQKQLKCPHDMFESDGHSTANTGIVNGMYTRCVACGKTGHVSIATYDMMVRNAGAVAK